ncbi:hypothetical protein EDC01DRAFT_135474 [Geopyxis carbonaria]|nr:hypothetical protein EDC01DRAFT_135474 [Geopyxis carbonaria]
MNQSEDEKHCTIIMQQTNPFIKPIEYSLSACRDDTGKDTHISTSAPTSPPTSKSTTRPTPSLRPSSSLTPISSLTQLPSLSPPESSMPTLRYRKKHGMWCRVKTRIFPEVKQRENIEKEKREKRERRWRETETVEFLKTNKPMHRTMTGELVPVGPGGFPMSTGTTATTMSSVLEGVTAR